MARQFVPLLAAALWPLAALAQSGPVCLPVSALRVLQENEQLNPGWSWEKRQQRHFLVVAKWPLLPIVVSSVNAKLADTYVGKTTLRINGREYVGAAGMLPSGWFKPEQPLPDKATAQFVVNALVRETAIGLRELLAAGRSPDTDPVTKQALFCLVNCLFSHQQPHKDRHIQQIPTNAELRVLQIQVLFQAAAATNNPRLKQELSRRAGELADFDGIFPRPPSCDTSYGLPGWELRKK